jgi:hypothetical protein
MQQALSCRFWLSDEPVRWPFVEQIAALSASKSAATALAAKND